MKAGCDNVANPVLTAAPAPLPSPLPSPLIVPESAIVPAKDVARAGDIKEAVVNSLFSILSCIFEPAKKEGDGEIVYEDIRQISFIGSGSHGCVFLGEYRGKTVAVKKLKELNMTLKEMRHLRELKHENIIGFEGVCIRAPNFGVVME